MPKITLNLSKDQFDMLNKVSKTLSNSDVSQVLAPVFEGIPAHQIRDVCSTIQEQTDYGELLFEAQDELELQMTVEQLIALKKIFNVLTMENAMVLSPVFGLDTKTVSKFKSKYGKLDLLSLYIKQQLEEQGV